MDKETFNLEQRNAAIAAAPALREQIVKAAPTECGLFPHEILFLDRVWTVGGAAIASGDPLLIAAGITDPAPILKRLRKEGFVGRGTTFEYLCETPQKIMDDILVSIGVQPGNSRERDASKLMVHLGEDELDLYFPDRPFDLTMCGYMELQEHFQIPKAAALEPFFPGLSIWTVEPYLKSHPQTSFCEWANQLFKQKLQHLSIQGHSREYNDLQLAYIRFLWEEGWPKDAASLLARRFYRRINRPELSGLPESERRELIFSLDECPLLSDTEALRLLLVLEGEIEDPICKPLLFTAPSGSDGVEDELVSPVYCRKIAFLLARHVHEEAAWQLKKAHIAFENIHPIRQKS